MWKCHKCNKPVFFAERKQSLGYDWHPECLRCEECGKRLNPGQHAEHKGVPYCHVPCYGALFGPQLFGHGTRVESHKSFGQKQYRPMGGPVLNRDILDSKLKSFNDFYDSRSLEIRSREVNGRLVLEGALKVYWGVQGVIHLKEDDDQRVVVTIRKRNSGRYNDDDEQLHDNSDKENLDTTESTSIDNDNCETETYETCSMSDSTSISSAFSSKEVSPVHKSFTLPSKLDVKDLDWDEIDDLLQVERKVDDSEKLYQTMPSPLPSQLSSDLSDEKSLTEVSKTLSQNDDSAESPTLQTNSSELEEFATPIGTIREGDFEDFKKQTNQDYISGTNDMGNVNANTLKLNQPIDPSRINDSLKLYSDNIMSKSYNGIEHHNHNQQSSMPLMSLSQDWDYSGIIDGGKINDTFNIFKNNNESNDGTLQRVQRYEENIKLNSPQRGFQLQKSESATSRTIKSEDDSWIEKSINRSKSGPNCVGLGNNFIENENADTFKPSTIRKVEQKLVNIKMDCYDDFDGDVDDESKSSYLNGANHGESYIDADISSVSRPAEQNGVVLRRKKIGSTAIKRRSGNRRSRTKLKRRCSINGHFYNRETSFFTPPHGSQMSVWITSLVNTQEVVNLLLEKYKVDSKPDNFALFIIRDNGEQRRLREDEYPLVVRVMLGPHEDVAKLYLVDAQYTPEISCEVAQFLNLSVPECNSILDRYNDEQEREAMRIKEKYEDMRRRITQRMESLKVRL